MFDASGVGGSAGAGMPKSLVTEKICHEVFFMRAGNERFFGIVKICGGVRGFSLRRSANVIAFFGASPAKTKVLRKFRIAIY